MGDRITPDHLKRMAIVYVRQSSPGQVRNHMESARVQRGLTDMAVSLGWTSPIIISDDLGISAGGFAERAGFQRMVADVSLSKVGILLCSEVSRLSRNSRDWAQLFEVCGYVDTLVGDLDQVYDVRIPNDRLLLGIKGTLSEYELTVLRQRSSEAIHMKARRGELQFTLPPGLCWTDNGTIERNPDLRVQKAIEMVFHKFLEVGSVRQVLMWLREQNLSLPTLESEGRRMLEWRLPTYRMVLSVIRSPFYAGAYVFGRRQSRTRIIDGRPRKTDGHYKPIDEWTVLIRDHHPGYISWEQFERNQRVLEDNAHMKGATQRKAGRAGRCLLTGLLRCGRCGRMLHVMYGRGGYARYECREANKAHGAPRCIAFGARGPDEAIGAALLRVVQGRGLQAAIEACALAEQQQEQQYRAVRLELEQARYEAKLAERRYEAVDPDQRLVAAQLEARWNSALERVVELEERLKAQDRNTSRCIDIDPAALHSLGANLEMAWNCPSTDMRLKQRITQLLIQEVIVTADDDKRQLCLTIHWVGGRHSELCVARRKAGEHRHCTGHDAEAVIRRMAGQWPDADIAATLNRLGLRTGMGNTWTVSRVQSVRKRLRLVDFDAAHRTPTLSLNQAADRLGVGSWVIRRLIKGGVLEAVQVVPRAPWQVDPSTLDTDAIRSAAKAIQTRTFRGPSNRGNPRNLRIPGV